MYSEGDICQQMKPRVFDGSGWPYLTLYLEYQLQYFHDVTLLENKLISARGVLNLYHRFVSLSEVVLVLYSAEKNKLHSETYA